MSSNIWKGSISFGLLNIPVALQTASEDKELHFSMLDERDLSGIKYKKVNESSGKEVPYEHIVKGYEFEKGEFVIVEDKDFERANVRATQTIDIEDFVLIDEIDPMLFDKPYYIVPQKGGEKGYFLLRDALRKTKKVAVGKVVLRTKQHLSLVMAKGDYLILEMIRFSHEVKEIDEVDYLKGIKAPKFSSKEISMAEKLINGMSSKWNPDKYKDTYYSDLTKRIKSKIQNHKGHKKPVEDEEEIEKIEASDSSDLLALLQDSLSSRRGKKSRSKKTSKKKTPLHQLKSKTKSKASAHERLH